MARYGYNYLQPLGPKQLRRQVRSQINPYIRSGERTIGAYTDALARALAPAAAQTQANYGRATQQQAAVDQALANRLQGAGGAAQSDLAAQLAQAGLPGAPAQAVGQVGTGAANAGYAQGSAGLTQLLAQGAAAQQYAGQLPNIARLTGMQQQQQNRSQLLSQLPKLYQAAQAQEFQKAIAVQSGLVSGAKLQQQASQFSQRQGQQARQFSRRQQQQQQHFDTQTQLALGRINISKGQLDLARQREVRLTKGKKGQRGGFTPTQISKFRATAIDTVKDWKHGVPAVTNANGSVKSPAIQARPHDARGAFRYLVLHGVPASIADWATGQVYGRWKVPGERGRRGRGGTGPR